MNDIESDYEEDEEEYEIVIGESDDLKIVMENYDSDYSDGTDVFLLQPKKAKNKKSKINNGGKKYKTKQTTKSKTATISTNQNLLQIRSMLINMEKGYVENYHNINGKFNALKTYVKNKGDVGNLKV